MFVFEFARVRRSKNHLPSFYSHQKQGFLKQLVENWWFVLKHERGENAWVENVQKSCFVKLSTNNKLNTLSCFSPPATNTSLLDKHTSLSSSTLLPKQFAEPTSAIVCAKYPTRKILSATFSSFPIFI